METYNEVNAIRSKVVDKIILIMLIFFTPPYITAIFRWIEIGWQDINIVHTSMFLLLVFLAVYRKRLNFRFKVFFLAVLFAILGLAALWFFAFSGIHYFVIISIAMVSLFTNRRNAFIFIGFLSSFYILIGFLFISELKNASVELNQFSHSVFHWITIILSLIAFCAVYLAGFGELHKELVKNVEEKTVVKNELEKHLHELETTKLKLDNTIEELSTLNATKDKFFSIIAHDLKSPFNSILGFSELLDENSEALDNQQKKEIIALLHSSVSNAFALLEDLLLWARMQQDGVKFNPENENLFLLATKIMEEVRLIAQKKRVDISLNIPHDLFFEVDRFMLSTIIRNLVSNAIKYTYAENGKVNISAKKIKNDSNLALVEICIQDNGTGIPEDIVPKLFNIGENVSMPGTKNEKGTGLGLIICKDFVLRHGGKIWVESKVGEGSSFFFTISENLQTR